MIRNKYYLVAIIILNIISFFMYYIDKRRSIKHRNRISEDSLLISSFLFGALGSILAMEIFRHKTKKKKFKILVPLFFCIQAYIIYKYL